jgi:hypothetical protein
MVQLKYINVRLTRASWKLINQEREPNETMDEVVTRILSDREKLRMMLHHDPVVKELR